MINIVSDGPIICDFSHIFGLVCTQIHVIIHPTIKKNINIIMLHSIKHSNHTPNLQKEIQYCETVRNASMGKN